LQHFEQQYRTMQSATQAAAKAAAERIAEFGRSRPDFQQLRPAMAALMQAGEATTIEAAYELAQRLRGPSQADVARQAAEKRRELAAKAARAKTPRTSSVGADAPVDRSLREELEYQLREASRS
jgi:hypothetical protein